MPNRPFVPTPKHRIEVQIMHACGIPQGLIAQRIINPNTALPIDAKTLRKVFRKELDEAKQVSNGLVAQSLFRKATGNGPQSVTAAMFWLERQAGWKKPSDGDDEREKDPPTPVSINFTLKDARVDRAGA